MELEYDDCNDLDQKKKHYSSDEEKEVRRE